MSLWHYMFALHNGRFFQRLLKQHTRLVVPLGGTMLLLGLLTGGFDWLYRKGALKV